MAKGAKRTACLFVLVRVGAPSELVVSPTQDPTPPARLSHMFHNIRVMHQAPAVAEEGPTTTISMPAFAPLLQGMARSAREISTLQASAESALPIAATSQPVATVRMSGPTSSDEVGSADMADSHRRELIGRADGIANIRANLDARPDQEGDLAAGSGQRRADIVSGGASHRSRHLEDLEERTEIGFHWRTALGCLVFCMSGALVGIVSISHGRGLAGRRGRRISSGRKACGSPLSHSRQAIASAPLSESSESNTEEEEEEEDNDDEDDNADKALTVSDSDVH